MPKTKVRVHAALTNDQGILLINELIETIDQIPNLAKSFFGSDVREHLVSMRARLKDGAFFSRPMEVALENWGKAISKWIIPPKERQ